MPQGTGHRPSGLFINRRCRIAVQRSNMALTFALHESGHHGALMAPAAKPTLRLFGSLAVVGGDDAAPLGKRARGILGYLVLNPRRATRDRLIGLFWPDRGEAQARASLRQCLVEVRGLLGDALVADREAVALDADRIDSDWHALDRALANDDPATLTAAIDAIGAEPLLDGLEFGEAFDDWLRACRAGLDGRLAAAVIARIEAARTAGEAAAALALADAWGRRDPRDETVAAAAIAIEMERQAPAAARRRFRAFEALLARDGDGPPGPALLAALETAPAAAPSPPPPPAAAAGAPDTDRPASNAVLLATGARFTLPTKPSIAVLPFADLAGDADAFADGMVEEICTVLSRFSTIFVIAGLSSLSYRDTPKPAAVIAAELGVRYLLEGSVRKSAGRVRIAVKLIDAIIGEQIWAERFDETLEDIFDLQDRVASAIVSLIDSTLTSAEMRRAVVRPTSSPDAYELVLCANARLTRYTREAVHEALDFARRATEFDPDYAWAWATLGFAHATLELNQWCEDRPAARAAARDAAERAMRIGGDDLMALTVTAGLFATQRDLPRASQLIERAMTLNPQKAFVLFWAGVIDAELGNFARGLDRLELAVRHDPRSMYRPWMLMTMGICLFGLERLDEATVVAGEALRLLPNYPVPHLVLGASLALGGRAEEARRVFAGLDDFGGFAVSRRFLHQPSLQPRLDAVFAPLTEPA